MRTAKMDIFRVALIVLAILLFSALYLYQERRVAGAFGFPLDDAWIHCQFARNLARGDGMSYNPGVPISGSTAPLWTFMLAASYLLVPNFILTAKVMSVALHVLSCILVFKMLVFILEDVRFAFLGAVFTAMISGLTWGSLSGMEVMLSTFLTLAGTYLHLLYRRETGPKQYLSTIVFALASLARPESMQLVFIALADSFLVGRLEDREKLTQFGRRAAVHVLLFMILLVPYFIFNYMTSGQPFPNTFAAKSAGGLMVLLSERNVGEFWRTFLVYPRLYLSATLEMSLKHNLLLYWLMFVGTARIIVDSFRKSVRNRALIVPLIFFVYPAFMGIVSPNRGVLIWIMRYMANLNPFYVVLGVVGLHEALRLVRATLAELWVGKQAADRIIRPLQTAIIVVVILSLSIEEYENSKFYARGVENINSMQVKIGRWMRENSAADAVLAVNDIGAITYFSERKVIDLFGLITPEALPYRDRPGGTFEFLSLMKPDYVIIFPNWFPNVARRKELTPILHVFLETNAVCGGQLMTVYRTVWAEEEGDIASRSHAAHVEPDP